MRPPLPMITVGAVLLAGCQDPVTPAPEDSSLLESAASRSMPYEIFEWSGSTTIPGGNDAGILIGPLSTRDDGRRIQDVAACLEVFHPYTGQVRAKLLYDADRDATFDAETSLKFYLATTDLEDRPSYAYPITLDGVYFFRHEQRSAGLENWDLGTFDRFRGLPKGGDFYLWIADTGPSAAGAAGAVAGWSVHVR